MIPLPWQAIRKQQHTCGRPAISVLTLAKPAEPVHIGCRALEGLQDTGEQLLTEGFKACSPGDLRERRRCRHIPLYSPPSSPLPRLAPSHVLLRV